MIGWVAPSVGRALCVCKLSLLCWVTFGSKLTIVSSSLDAAGTGGYLGNGFPHWYNKKLHLNGVKVYFLCFSQWGNPFTFPPIPPHRLVVTIVGLARIVNNWVVIRKKVHVPADNGGRAPLTEIRARNLIWILKKFIFLSFTNFNIPTQFEWFVRAIWPLGLQPVMKPNWRLFRKWVPPLI